LSCVGRSCPSCIRLFKAGQELKETPVGTWTDIKMHTQTLTLAGSATHWGPAAAPDSPTASRRGPWGCSLSPSSSPHASPPMAPLSPQWHHGWSDPHPWHRGSCVGFYCHTQTQITSHTQKLCVSFIVCVFMILKELRGYQSRKRNWNPQIITCN